jgi:hypothetical protein
MDSADNVSLHFNPVIYYISIEIPDLQKRRRSPSTDDDDHVAKRKAVSEYTWLSVERRMTESFGRLNIDDKPSYI